MNKAPDKWEIGAHNKIRKEEMNGKNFRIATAIARSRACLTQLLPQPRTITDLPLKLIDPINLV